ncbi:uncharacterized protein MYCFIDRAFT_180407 [Pseudocercospora fijiensis CIRAD86]|uniref:Uncharacterized protein n=1 Tax=Pseudocercospora fijiensis (strain CIRAD86) TaxID=383855 RepID=M2ZD72_PSEFD|nr:uncharacterized protein MYCFIDRAFT_180407 [Pseudocercospora fijiensis CIRAD86]EME77074.1 hypothetical protein MYCFIDRAFT_180407 [Pseudocercospora fijiensis CIRAD86]
MRQHTESSRPIHVEQVTCPIGRPFTAPWPESKILYVWASALLSQPDTSIVYIYIISMEEMKLHLRRNDLSRVRRQELLGAKEPAWKGKGHVWAHKATYSRTSTMRSFSIGKGFVCPLLKNEAEKDVIAEATSVAGKLDWRDKIDKIPNANASAALLAGSFDREFFTLSTTYPAAPTFLDFNASGKATLLLQIKYTTRLLGT